MKQKTYEDDGREKQREKEREKIEMYSSFKIIYVIIFKEKRRKKQVFMLYQFQNISSFLKH